MPFSVAVLKVRKKERAVLEKRVRAHLTPQRAVKRAQIILGCADGRSIRQMSIEVGMDQHQAGIWRKRFIKHRVDGLNDVQRPGRPRRFGHDERMRLAAVATSERVDPDLVTSWTHENLADTLSATGFEISASQVGRILAAMNLDVTKVRGWLNRRDDPEFWARVRDVCGLYLNCPDNAIVLSVDEKTAIQARERKHPDQVAKPGRVRRHEWEYIRHGTASLFASLNVHTGQVTAAPIPGKDDSVNFCGFLDQIEATIDPALDIHIVLDNGASHTSKHTKAWFVAHPRWTVHHTPPHASWVNQVELFFSILQRKVIRNGNFKSRDDLIKKLLAHITEYDKKAKPFKWTYSADPLVA